MSFEIRFLKLLSMLFYWAWKRNSCRKLETFAELAILEPSPSKARYILAKTVASMWYLWGNITYIAFVVIAVFFTYKMEVSMEWVPESESKNAVGQWSTWVTLGFAVSGAIIRRMMSSQERSKSKINLDDVAMDPNQNYEMALMAHELAENRWLLYQYVGALLAYEWRSFLIWWQNPRQVLVKESQDKGEGNKEYRGKAEEVSDALEQVDFLEKVAFSPGMSTRGINLALHCSKIQKDEIYCSYTYDFLDEAQEKVMIEKGRKRAKGKTRRKIGVLSRRMK